MSSTELTQLGNINESNFILASEALPRRKGAGPLSEEIIIQAAEEHFKKTGVWPTCADRTSQIALLPDDNWQAIDSAGSRGSRNLAKGRTLAEILAPIKVTYGSVVPQGPLSEDLIIQAAIDQFNKSGRWPTTKDNISAIPLLPGYNWNMINQSGRSGGRNLEKGRTLAAILKPIKERFGSKVRVRGGVLSEDVIIEAATEHFLRTGVWPTSDDLTSKIPLLPGDTWATVQSAGKGGYRNLKKGNTLAVILAPTKEKSGNKVRIEGGPLSETIIIQSAIEHFDTTGKWPSTKDKLSEIPLLLGDSWQAIDCAGQKGHRNLKRGRTLREILRPIKEEAGYKVRVKGKPLTEDLIVNAATDHYRKSGEWPTANDVTTIIPLLSGDTWQNINAAGQTGCRGLTKGRTLQAILGPIKDHVLTENEITQAAIEYFDQNQEWPTKSDSTSIIPSLPSFSWNSINYAGRVGSRGLEKGRTLSKILNPVKGMYGSKAFGGPLSEDIIIQAATHHYHKTGKWPSSVDSNIDIPLLPGDNWRAINASGAQGFRGLQIGRTLARILRPLKEQFSLHLGSSHLPNVFYNDRLAEISKQSPKVRTSFLEKELGASFEENRSITFLKGEAFEQLVGLLLLSRNEKERVIPQYCLVVDKENGFFGMRADFKVGREVIEVKWGGASANIEETYNKHQAVLKGELEYRLILLEKNAEIKAPHSYFHEHLKNSSLAPLLELTEDYMRELLRNEKQEDMVELRDFLYGLLMKGNMFEGSERLSFLENELSGFLEASERGEYSKAHRYSIYCPLSAHFEYNGKLYSATISPPALREEKPDQFKTLFHFGALRFRETLDRDIAVMCELGTQGGKGLLAKELLQKEKGLVKDPIFTFPDGSVVKAGDVTDLNQLGRIIDFEKSDFQFGVEYLSYFGALA